MSEHGDFNVVHVEITGLAKRFPLTLTQFSWSTGIGRSICAQLLTSEVMVSVVNCNEFTSLPFGTYTQQLIR
jgi:hypothetical protein